MRAIRFKWEGRGLLIDALRRPTTKASLRLFADRPSVLILWRSDGHVLEVSNQMHDLKDRCEIGSLVFRIGDATGSCDLEIDFEDEFVPNRISKMTIDEESIAIDAGITLESTDARRLVILPGAYPYTLAIEGIADRPHIFEPEYPLARYHLEPL